MKNLILALIFLFAINAFALPGSSNIGAVTTNPTSGTVLSTSGSLVSGSSNPSPSGNYRVQAWISSSVAAAFDLQSVFAGTVVAHIYIMVPANSSVAFTTDEISFTVPDGITLQIVNVSSITGTVQSNLFWAIETLN